MEVLDEGDLTTTGGREDGDGHDDDLGSACGSCGVSRYEKDRCGWRTRWGSTDVDGKDLKGVLSGKVVWITGGSSGIGKAFAQVVKKSGAKVILTARSLNKLEEVRKELGDDVVVIPHDVADIAAADQVVQKAVTAFPQGVDVFISCAGVSSRSLARETTLDVDRKLMDINFFGSISLSKPLVEDFVKVIEGSFCANELYPLERERRGYSGD